MHKRVVRDICPGLTDKLVWTPSATPEDTGGHEKWLIIRVPAMAQWVNDPGGAERSRAMSSEGALQNQVWFAPRGAEDGCTTPLQAGEPQGKKKLSLSYKKLLKWPCILPLTSIILWGSEDCSRSLGIKLHFLSISTSCSGWEQQMSKVSS